MQDPHSVFTRGEWLEENVWKWVPHTHINKQWGVNGGRMKEQKSLSWHWWTAKAPPSVCAFLCLLCVVRLTPLGHFHPTWELLRGALTLELLHGLRNTRRVCIVIWSPLSLIPCLSLPSTMFALLALSIFLPENRAGIVKANAGSQVGSSKK